MSSWIGRGSAPARRPARPAGTFRGEMRCTGELQLRTCLRTAAGCERMTDLAQSIGDVLAPTLGSVEIVELTRLTAGANRETWSFDAVAADERTPLILQMERGVDPAHAGACARDGMVLRAVAAAGAPVPEVVASGDLPNALGRSYVVTRRIDGETIARRLQRDQRWTAARERFVGDCARALVQIHAVDPGTEGLEALPRITDPLGPIRESYLALDDPHPAFDLALRWLDRNRPDPRPATLVHGDFRLGNLLLDEAGLAAVLDWEIANVGDPNADLGWLCVRAWRFGSPRRVGGLGSGDDLLAAYNAAAGTNVDRRTLRWWELWGTVRWGGMCLGMGGTFRLGLTNSIELGMIGRRVVENEADIVDLLHELLEER